MKKPCRNLVAMMRQRRKEILRDAQVEFAFVAEMVCADLEGEMDRHECEYVVQLLCERNALSLQWNWSRLFPRHCRAHVAQNAPFYAELPQPGRKAVPDMSSVARLLVGLRRTVRNGNRVGC